MSDALSAPEPMRVRVLVAEDEAIIRLDLVETLREEGYEVVGETGRGDEAVRLVRACEPDVAILDIKMPGLDGLSAAKEIADAGLAAVVVLTAFSQRALIEQARDSGVLGYVVKPFQKAELVAAIEVAHGRHLQLLALKGQVHTLEQRLEDRKLVDRAKGRGQEDEDPEAYLRAAETYVEKMSNVISAPPSSSPETRT